MDCAACAQTVEKVVAALDGVRAAHVSFGNATLAVDGDVAPDRVSAAVARAGYRAAPLTRRRPEPACAVLAARRADGLGIRVARAAGRGGRGVAVGCVAGGRGTVVSGIDGGGWLVDRALGRGRAAASARLT